LKAIIIQFAEMFKNLCVRLLLGLALWSETLSTRNRPCGDRKAVVRVVELAPGANSGIWVHLLWIGFVCSQLCSTDYFWSGLLQNWLSMWRKLVCATAILAVLNSWNSGFVNSLLVYIGRFNNFRPRHSVPGEP